MSQYNSRLLVMVKGASVWKKLKEIKLEKYGIDADASEVFDTKKKSVVLEGFSCEDEKLLGLVKDIAKNVKTDGLAIADTTNYNVEPYIYGAYYFGGKANSFVFEGDDERIALQDDVEITEPQRWIEYSDCEVSAKESSFLKDFSIKVKQNKKKTDIKYVCKIIVLDEENGNISDTLKKVPYINPEKNLDEIINSPMGGLMNGGIYSDISSASIVIPKMTENEIKDYAESVKNIDGAKVLICVWDGKDKTVHVWKCMNNSVSVVDVDEKEKMADMKGYLHKDDDSSYDDLIDLKKYIGL